MDWEKITVIDDYERARSGLHKYSGKTREKVDNP